MSDLRYPIGKFEWIPFQRMKSRWPSVACTTSRCSPSCRHTCAPRCEGLSPEQLDTPYRPEGWTVRQVVHHVPESHMNAYVRFKLALTEDHPTIKPYDEDAWAKLPDVAITPIEVSLQLLAALHSRWVDLLRSMQPSDFARTLFHPERGLLTLDQMLAMYAWHSAHHLAHITSLRERMGWKQHAAAAV